MKKSPFNIYVFYIICLSVLFFNGVDSSLLYQSAFLDGKTYSNENYLHFFLSFAGGLFIGFFFTKKFVQQYNLSYILRVSFLLAASSIFVQYQKHHFGAREFEQIILDNFICSLILGLMTYSISRLLNDKNQLSYFRKHKFYWIFITVFGFFYSQLVSEKNIETAFILNGLIYFFSYVFFLIYDVNKIDITQEVVKEKLFSYVFLFIFAISFIVFSNFLIHITPIAEQSYMLYITALFLLFEGTQNRKNKIKQKG